MLILGGLSAIGPLATDMYLPSLPALSRDLSATTTQTQLTLSAGILGLALGQVIIGPISDSMGRRRPLLFGLAAFVATSLLCAVAPSVAALAFLRFAQGFTGAAGIVIALAIASDLYSGTALARCLSLLMLVSGLAPIAAPVLGSLLLSFTSWRGVFLALGVVGVALFVLVALGLRETLEVSHRQRGGVSATLRAFRELIGARRFIGYALASGAAFSAGITYISISPFILQNVYGLSPQVVGIVLAANALGIVILAQVSARLVGRVAPRALLTWGIAATALGGMSLLVVVMLGIGLPGVLPPLFVVVASLGLVQPNAASLALANTRAAGSASALLGVLQLVIGSVAAPLVGLGGSMSALPLALAISGFGIAGLVAVLLV